MHTQGGMGGSSSMDQETHLAHHDQTFGHEQWGDMSPYIQATMPDYGGGFGYMPPMSHGLPSESLGRMPPPATPPQQQPLPQQQHSQTPPPHHPTLPMLMVPSNPTWPSMLTNPNSYNSSPPVPIQPASATASLPPLNTTRPPITPTVSQPRKTLTDEDRRRMCQYHIDHPTMKQTEIGALFGVERSTVSKVLSRKDKWLNPEDRSNSPIKKSKGKIPDIDKTLANWLRNEQHKGRHVSDSEIQEQARMYARPFREAETKINNPSWLEKFKQKHSVGGGRLLRRASETNIPRAAVAAGGGAPGKPSAVSPILASPQPSSAISSDSPVHHQSVSPFSAGPRDVGEEEKEGGAGGMMMDFSEPPSSTATGPTFKFASTNQSTTSLGSGFTSDTAGSSFSDNNNNNSNKNTTMSPTGTGQFTFSPDPNVGGFLPPSVHHNHHGHNQPQIPGGPDFQRPRSQTFPTLDLEYMNQAAAGGEEPGNNNNNSSSSSNDPLTPRFMHGSPGHGGGVPSTAPSSALESSPTHEFPAAGPFGIDNAISPPPPPHHHLHHHHHHHHNHNQQPILHHSSSAGSLQGGGRHQGVGGGAGGGALSSSVASSPPVSPTQEDARRAADTLLSFIANSGPNGLVDRSDYNAMVRLTEKLRLHQQQQQAQQQQQVLEMGSPMGGAGGGGGGMAAAGAAAAAAAMVGGLGMMGGLDRIPEGDAEMGGTGGQHVDDGGGMIKHEEGMMV